MRSESGICALGQLLLQNCPHETLKIEAVNAILFSVGSMLFSYLLLRGRISSIHWRGWAYSRRACSWRAFPCN
jgi:hypothetical protein